MVTLSVNLSDDKHSRLKKMAEQRHMSLNQLMEELSTIALVEFDAEMRFRTRAARGSGEQGLRLLAKIDKALSIPKENNSRKSAS